MWHPQNPAAASSALQSCPVPEKKKKAFHLFQNILGLFCGRPAASYITGRKEASFLAQPLDEGAVLGFQTSSLPFCVCFFVFLSISGEPQLCTAFKEPEQCLITFPGMFSCLIISKILCTFWLIPTEPWANVSTALFKASPESLLWMLMANPQLSTGELVINGVFFTGVIILHFLICEFHLLFYHPLSQNHEKLPQVLPFSFLCPEQTPFTRKWSCPSSLRVFCEAWLTVPGTGQPPCRVTPLFLTFTH